MIAADAAAVIRRMEERDLEAVMAIEVASFSTPWSRVSFQNLLLRSDTMCWVAELDDAVAGYAVLWYVGLEAELGNLAVAEAWRGRGLGRRLLDWTLERAGERGIERVCLEVRDSNKAARELYAGRGFVQVGLRRRYYRAPVEDALVLSLNLGALPVDSAGDRREQPPR